MVQKIVTLAICLLTAAACNKKTEPAENTAWKLGNENFQGSSAIRADNAIMVKTDANNSYLYARFAPGRVTEGKYKVVGGTPTAANEISFSVNRNGQDYISTSSGNPSATVTFVGEKMNILISNVWMLHLPFREDSLLLDAIMIEQ